MYINTQEAHLTRNNHLQGDHVSRIRDNFCPTVLSEKMNQSYQLLCCCLFYYFTNSMTKNRAQQYYQNLYFHTFLFLYNNHLVSSCSNVSLLVGGHGSRDHKVAHSRVRKKHHQIQNYKNIKKEKGHLHHLLNYVFHKTVKHFYHRKLKGQKEDPTQ